MQSSTSIKKFVNNNELIKTTCKEFNPIQMPKTAMGVSVSLTPPSSSVPFRKRPVWHLQGVPINMGIQSLSWFSIVIPDFKSHNIIMSAKVYIMKTVNGCKDVSIMSLQDEH